MTTQSVMNDFRETYVFGDAGSSGPLRFQVLSRLYDAHSIRQFKTIGVNDGWRCLDVGAGQGSIAVWLSLRVGATGTVVATDIDTHLLEALPYHNLSVMRHDVATDPLPTDTFDLVHTRLVLMHVRDRNRALDTLVASLRPGGWFVGEEYDALSTLADPSVSASEELLKTGIAMRRLMADRGVDLRCGRTLRDRLLAQGLVDVQAEGTISVWHGGSPGAALIRLSYEQLAEPMIQGGYLSEAELIADLARLEDPAMAFPSPILWSVRGRRPTLT
jgi:SAM-dependent methyltransferase